MPKKLEFKGKFGGIDVSGAAVGQTIVVKAVDESGKPTEWEAVDMQEQVQADWNQNDSTAADYVKNRPFCEDLVQTELFDICALADAVGASWMQLDEKAYAVGLDVDPSKPIFIDIPIVVGNEYIIAYNGTLYKYIAEDGSIIGQPDFIFIGDINDVNDNNEPPTHPAILLAPGEFFDGSDISGYVLVNAYSPSDTVPTELKVIVNIEKIMKLDKKYLPEGCLQQSDYSQFDETAADYIKNRPFYDDVLNKILTFTNVGTSGQGMVFLGNYLQLIVGEMYTVTVNDESFITEAVSYDDGTRIYLHYHTNSSEYKNVIQCRLDGENSQYYAFSWWSSGSTVSISGKFKRFKQIDNKYLNVVTSFDGQTGDVTLKNTSAVTYENTVVDGYPCKLISSINGNPYALNLGSTILLGYADNGNNYMLSSKPCILRGLRSPVYYTDAATKYYVDEAIASAKDRIILNSSTEGSAKQFQITVDDSGVITATEVTE